jgi:hypothetical protein
VGPSGSTGTGAEQAWRLAVALVVEKDLWA